MTTAKIKKKKPYSNYWKMKYALSIWYSLPATCILVFQYYAVYSQNGDHLLQTFATSTYLVTLHYLAVQRILAGMERLLFSLSLWSFISLELEQGGGIMLEYWPK